jgi:hypothetical protein
VHGANDTFTDFTVRRQKVLNALLWLKQNNPYYKAITIDYDTIAELPVNSIPKQIFVNSVPATCETLETNSVLGSHNIEPDDMNVHSDTELENDIDSDDKSQHNYTSFIPVPQQQQTEIEAIRSIIQHENITLPWPEISKTAVSEFTTEGLATMAFPTLFPYGTGDPTKKQRHHAVSLSDAFKHLISFGETVDGKIVWRFASHPRFMYWALNMKQRHQVLSQANVYMKQHPKDATLTLDQLKRMVSHADSEQLMSRFSRYISNVQGTKQYWYQRSLELRALIESKGTPTFFWTVSAADTYWPQLHELMPHDPNPTHSKKIQAVINNPHLADWYFTQRLSDLIKQWLYKEMDAEWHWYRFEYQSRGSTHAHGCAKLKSDPGLCQLMKKAAISWKLQKNLPVSGQFTTIEKQLIAEGNQAAEIVVKYCNWLTCTFNKDLPSDNWRMPTPENHPCAKNPLITQSHEQDYYDLVNVVEQHTKCSAAYCLKKKKGQTETKCRFEYPRQLQSETKLHFEELPNQRIHAKVITKRNDPLINSHNELLLKYWRANVDVQAIVDIEDCVRYMTKYAAKAETTSQTAKEIFRTCVNNQSVASQTSTVIRSAMIKSIGERDFSAQETAHMLLGLPLYSCTFSFATVAIDSIKTIEIQNNGTRTKISHKMSIVEAYAKRLENLPNNEAISEMNLMQFSEHFYINNNTVRERKTPVIVRTYPNYSSNSKGKSYPLYCKCQLIKYKPWKEQFSDAWGNLPDSDDTYIMAYHDFIQSATASRYVQNTAKELEEVEQYLQTVQLDNAMNSDEYEIHNEESVQQQEEWMLLSQLNPSYI